MAKYKIEFIVLIMAISCVIAGSVCTAEPNSPSDAEAVAQQTTTEENANNSWSLDPNGAWNFPQSVDNKELFGSSVKAIIIVVILCVAIILISKKMLPKMSNLTGRRIRIVETVHLTQRKTLHIIKVDDREVLIGSTNENITKLAELTDILNNPFEAQISDIEETNDQPKK